MRPLPSRRAVFEKVSKDYEDAVFGKVDVDANPALAQAFSVSAIPTLVVLRNNTVLFSQAGAMNESGRCGRRSTRPSKARNG